VHLDDGGRRERFDRYRVGGTLEGFKEIAGLAVGNSLIGIGLCVTFSGPVAALLGVEQPGVMLVGPPASYKTTLLVSVASPWGRHVDPNMANKLGFCIPFNATDNDLEDEAIAANHRGRPTARWTGGR
jgi:putative DNA primase/helicase